MTHSGRGREARRRNGSSGNRSGRSSRNALLPRVVAEAKWVPDARVPLRVSARTHRDKADAVGGKEAV